MADDPAARARALAEKFAAKYGGGSNVSGGYTHPPGSFAATTGSYGNGGYGTGANDTVLGKRSIRDESEGSGSKRKKITVPVDQFPDVNFPQLIFGPRGTTLKDLEQTTNTRIFLRGKGSQRDAPVDPNDEELHVLIQAESDEAMEAAAAKVTDLLHNPHVQREVKDQQLSTIHAGSLISPLQKDTSSNPSTFALSSALYANDEGFHMMAPRLTPEQMREERLAMMRGGSMRDGEIAKDVQVEADKVGLVIGRGGETVKQIQALTGCYIQVHKEVPGEPRGATRTITLKGTEAAIAAGEIEVHRVCNGGRVGQDGPGGPMGSSSGPRPGLGYTGASGNNEETVQVPGPMIGLVIGRGGDTVKSIQSTTGCIVQVQKDDGNAQGLRDVKLIGNASAIAAARQAIDEIIMSTREMQPGGGGSFAGPPRSYPPGPGVPGMDGSGGGGYRSGPLSGPGMVTITVPVPNMAVGTVLGRGGEIVRRLQQISGARIQISRDEGRDMRDVIVSGRSEQCDIAKREIEQIISMKSGGGIVDPRMIGSAGGHGGYGGGYGGPSQHGGYGGPPQHGGYGGPQGGYGGPHGGYGGPHGGYGGPPPQQPYGGHSAYPPQQPPHSQPPYGSDPYAAPGAPPAAAPAPAPAAPAEVEAPTPPTDSAAFESWWAGLTVPQQQAYYAKYYPDMLNQIQAGQQQPHQ